MILLIKTLSYRISTNYTEVRKGDTAIGLLTVNFPLSSIQTSAPNDTFSSSSFVYFILYSESVALLLNFFSKTSFSGATTTVEPLGALGRWFFWKKYPVHPMHY